MKKFPLEPIEKASRKKLRALQLERLRWSLKHAYERVPHYRSKFDAAGVKPGDCRSLADLAGDKLAVVAFLSLTTGQNVLLNQFGVDRSGLALELLLPLTARQLLLGRALGCALLTAASFLPALVAVVLAGGGRSPLWLAAVVLGLAGAYAVFFLVAAWLSLLFPKPANLAKLSQEGKPRPAAVRCPRACRRACRRACSPSPRSTSRPTCCG